MIGHCTDYHWFPTLFGMMMHFPISNFSTNIRCSGHHRVTAEDFSMGEPPKWADWAPRGIDWNAPMNSHELREPKLMRRKRSGGNFPTLAVWGQNKTRCIRIWFKFDNVSSMCYITHRTASFIRRCNSAYSCQYELKTQRNKTMLSACDRLVVRLKGVALLIECGWQS